MKAIISSTNDPLYSFFIPITTWCWNKLGVDVILFVPANVNPPLWLAMKEINKDNSNRNSSYGFVCPEHKSATYAQCSRLYAGGFNLPEDEILVTGDVDMIVFKLPPVDHDYFTVFGCDLVPEKQIPVCYVSATVKLWRAFFNKGRSAQGCLDDLLGDLECDSFRGNYFSKDQEELYNRISYYAPLSEYPRARPGTQFASHRVDRTDTNWRAYLGPDLMDAHLWREGYTDENFANIMELLQTQYPSDNFDWIRTYRNEYIKLL